MLNSLSEKSERDEIAFEFVPNPSFPQLDVLKRGETLYLEQEVAKDAASKLLAETLKGIRLVAKDNGGVFLDALCRLETGFGPELVRKWQGVDPGRRGQSFFPPAKSHTLALEEKISSKFEDRQEKKSDFLNDMDADLLSNELMNFTLELNPAAQPPALPGHNKTSSDNSIVYSSNSHMNTSHNNNASGFGNLTPIRSQNELLLPQQRVLTENSLNNTSTTSGLQKRSNEKPQPPRGNTPNTDRRLFAAGKDEAPANKLYKKKSKLAVPEKFEPTLDGLRKDALEIVDFTGAGSLPSPRTKASLPSQSSATRDSRPSASTSAAART